MAAVLTDEGRSLITAVLAGLPSFVPKYIGWGIGTTSAVHSDSALVIEVPTTTPGTRTTGTPSQVSSTVVNDTLQVTGVMISATTMLITEVGLFTSPDTSGSNILFLRSDFGGVPVIPFDQITFIIKLKLS